MKDKGLNLFVDCAAKWVYLYPQEEECTSSSWEYCKTYTPGIIGNSQADRIPTKLNKNGAAVKVRILVEIGILSDT